MLRLFKNFTDAFKTPTVLFEDQPQISIAIRNVLVSELLRELESGYNNFLYRINSDFKESKDDLLQTLKDEKKESNKKLGVPPEITAAENIQWKTEPKQQFGYKIYVEVKSDTNQPAS